MLMINMGLVIVIVMIKLMMVIGQKSSDGITMKMNKIMT